MTEIFVEREFDLALGRSDVMAQVLQSGNCFRIHKVDWQMSFLSSDGRKMLCWFSSRDVESGRLALREAGVDKMVLWPGTVHDAPAAQGMNPNVLVYRDFDSPVELEQIQAIEDKGVWCLETHRVKFVRTFFSLDKKRMACLYQARDAESVRLAQRQANMPFTEVLSFQLVLPDL